MLDRCAIEQLEKRRRAALINSLPGFKPVVLVGTVGPQGDTNLCVVNSCFHVGASPALLGMIIRPAPEGTERHTLDNIVSTRHYSLNAVSTTMAQRAHHTSARFNRDQSEFDECGFESVTIDGTPAPFVSESPLKIGLTLQDHQPLAINGTHLIIGSVEQLSFANDVWRDDGTLDLTGMDLVAGAGLDGYHNVGPGRRFSYAKPNDTPREIR
jgi:flavin reductase (DIM6/NTAB) family NADH-FMN oxidoreductase RutF